MKKTSLLLFFLALLLFSCSSDDTPEEIKELTIEAKIVEAGGGTCAFLIQPDEDPDTFLFGEIPEHYQVDGYPVIVTYSPVADF